MEENKSIAAQFIQVRIHLVLVLTQGEITRSQSARQGTSSEFSISPLQLGPTY